MEKAKISSSMQMVNSRADVDVFIALLGCIGYK